MWSFVQKNKSNVWTKKEIKVIAGLRWVWQRIVAWFYQGELAGIQMSCSEASLSVQRERLIAESGRAMIGEDMSECCLRRSLMRLAKPIPRGWRGQMALFASRQGGGIVDRTSLAKFGSRLRLSAV
jgi:hypothetical protein